MHPHLLLFDLGGVVFELGYTEAIARFSALGLRDAEKHLDVAVQTGIFGKLERGEIGKEEFRCALSEIIGREISMQACAHAWLGYFKSLPSHNLEALKKLRAAGFRLCLLSNTNPFMLDHVRSTAFDGRGNALDDYFDKLYVSCECGMMKPDANIFQHVLQQENMQPEKVLFIDDSPRNTAAAEALGIQTLLVHEVSSWIQPLGNLLGITL